MRAVSRVLSWALITCSLAVLIATAQAASSKLASPADMGATDGGTLTLSSIPAGTLTFSNSLWAPPAPVKCKRGHNVSPYTWNITYWDALHQRRTMEIPVCPVCYGVWLHNMFGTGALTDTVVTP